MITITSQPPEHNTDETTGWLEPLEPCRSCQGREYIDKPIHDGRSVRRDCKRCGRFRELVGWYGVTYQV